MNKHLKHSYYPLPSSHTVNKVNKILLTATALFLGVAEVAAQCEVGSETGNRVSIGTGMGTMEIKEITETVTETQPLDSDLFSEFIEPYSTENQTNHQDDIPNSITNITNTQPFMLGAIVGDIVGSTHESRRSNIKSKEFDLFVPRSHPTDDSVMSLAVAQWLTEDPTHSRKELVKYMQQLGQRYPHAGYGGNFTRWLYESDPKPYNSWGNGSAMRVSPVGLYASSMKEALELAEISADVSHNHDEGIKGAQAIAAAIYLARQGRSKESIKQYIQTNFHYDLDRKLDDIRPKYKFDVSCQGSVPEAIIAYLESTDFEDAIRNAISIGGDSDTIAAMAGSIAAVEYGIPENLTQECLSRMNRDLKEILEKFEKMIAERDAALKAQKAAEEAEKENKAE